MIIPKRKIRKETNTFAPTKVKSTGHTWLLSFLLLFYACETQTSWNFDYTENSLLVVNGIITNEKKQHDIVLNRTAGDLNEEFDPVRDALVIIADGDSNYLLIENPVRAGTYQTDTNFRAVINKKYTLLIHINGIQYSSEASMLPVTPFNKLKWRFDEDRQMYTIDSVNQAFNSSESAMYEINIDWTHVSGYDSIPATEKTARLYYYSFSTIDISEVFSPQKEEIYFPAGTLIIERKYSLSPQHVVFLRSMLLETEWRGGLFDVAQGNAYTNLSPGAVGFFGACTVIEEGFIVN